MDFQLVACTLDCRGDNFLLLGAEQAAVAGVGVERKHGYAWFHYGEIGGERLVE